MVKGENMLFTLKTLLLSSAILTQDDMTLQARVNTLLSQNRVQTLHDEKRDKAAKLVSQSSYASVIEHNEDLGLERLQEACNL